MIPLTRDEDGGLEAEALWIDRFGNVQLNVDPDEITLLGGDVVRVVVGGRSRIARRVEAFAELGVGEVGVLVDSYGLISIAADRTSAAEVLDVAEGDAVRLEPVDDDAGTSVTTPIQLRPRSEP
jgi:S-adenosylmethionine hydrolase